MSRKRPATSFNQRLALDDAGAAIKKTDDRARLESPSFKPLRARRQRRRYSLAARMNPENQRMAVARSGGEFR